MRPAPLLLTIPIRLAALMLLAAPVRGGEVDAMVGVGVAPVDHTARAFVGSLELQAWSTRRRFGVWGAFDAAHRSRWSGFGLMVGAPFGDRWFVALGAGPGWYPDQRTFDLGSQKVYRSTAYLMGRLPNGWEAGLTLSHYSNGGSAEHNPGAESLRIVLSIPFGRR